MLVRRLLFSLGYRFRVHTASLPGKPDVVFPSRKKVVFCHGCFWHMHDCKRGRSAPATNKEFWQNKRFKNVERDSRARESLRKLGWSSDTVWECELEGPSQRLVLRLQAFLGPPNSGAEHSGKERLK
jgi:DNA mismatch endonuclease (patch repair protein)